MAFIEMDFASGGGGSPKDRKSESGTFTAQNGTKTITISTITQIEFVYCVFRSSKTYDSGAYYNEKTNTVETFKNFTPSGNIVGVDGINGNEFTFTWNGSDSFDYVICGY